MDKSMRTYRPATAAAVIIANMIGTGVFTSLGSGERAAPD